MQSTYKTTTQTQIKQISIEWNAPEIRIEKCQKPIGKYKKVGKQTKLKLISLVEQGVSIIKASSSLRINYSTAKSLLQNFKKTGSGPDYSKDSTSPSCQQEIDEEICVTAQ